MVQESFRGESELFSRESSSSLERLEDARRKSLEYMLRRLEREKPIPEFLYHITPKENLGSIMAEGLNPSKLIFEDKEVVGLADDIDFAVRVASTTQETKLQRLAVLRIDTSYLTPSRIDNYLREEDPEEENPIKAAVCHEVHYDTDIPPEAIEVVKDVEAEKKRPNESDEAFNRRIDPYSKWLEEDIRQDIEYYK